MRSSESRPVCINVISFCPTSQTPAAATPADTYLRRHREYIFKSSANIFLNVLQMYFCKVFLFMICALQLQNLKSNAKMGIDDTNYLILTSFHCTVFIFHFHLFLTLCLCLKRLLVFVLPVSGSCSIFSRRGC